MSEVRMKVKEKTERLGNICDRLASVLETHLNENFNDADEDKVGKVVDMIKDLGEAQEKAIKSLYYEQIMEAMQESEYGEDYDLYGRRGYRGRSKTTGRYMHRPYEEMMPEDMRREMDMDRGRMYYSEIPVGSGSGTNTNDGQMHYNRGYERGYEDGMNNSSMEHSGRIEKARRGYEEAKEAKRKEESIQKLNEMVSAVTNEFKPLIPSMDVTEKSILRNGLQAIQNMIN